MSLHNDYRPTKWSQVYGQDAIVKAMEASVAERRSQAYILSGPSGTGKTTLARIAGNELNATITEVPAAVHTGVDAMRDIEELVRYRPLNNQGRAIILDEAHRLSGQAWDCLLKAVEEPPPDVFWFFCTTNPSKIPVTIIRRCTHFQLTNVSNKELDQLLDEICELEKIDLVDGIGELVVKEARGSPRQLLVNLDAVRSVESKKEATTLLRVAVEREPILNLCRFLAKGTGSWRMAVSLIKVLEDEGEGPESIRIIVCNYFAAALKGQTGEPPNDKSAAHFLDVLDAFSTPYREPENMAPLYLSVGRIILGD